MFDPNPHLFKMLIIRCGQLIFPGEKDISALYKKTSMMIGSAPFKTSTAGSDFDASHQLIRLITIAAGEKLREARWQDAEPDKDKLFAETIKEFGLDNMAQDGSAMPTVLPISKMGMNRPMGADHLPSPQEMKDDQGNYVMPRDKCPKCGKEGAIIIHPICPTCEKSEKGKYFTELFCGERDKEGVLIQGTGCGYSEVSTKRYSQWLTEKNPNWRGGMKKDLGVKTVTDDGLK